MMASFSCIPSAPTNMTLFKTSLSNQKAVPLQSRSNREVFVTLATANVSGSEEFSKKKIVMIDPLEAKRSAAKQMQEIQAKEQSKRHRKFVGIKGASAMLGLTAALVAEGQTGNGILAQLARYWTALAGFFGLERVTRLR